MSLKKLLMFPKEQYAKHSSAYNDLINAESALGRTIFGPIPAGHQREFFELKKNYWIWHESWLINSGRDHDEITIIYNVRPEGVFKKHLRGRYEKLEGDELNNFCNAVYTYFNLIKTKLYR